jgi:hypothetical protein
MLFSDWNTVKVEIASGTHLIFTAKMRDVENVKGKPLGIGF